MDSTTLDELNNIIHEITERLKKVAEQFEELCAQLNECCVEIRKPQKFTPCLRIGAPRYFASTRKLWQKNKALYLCPYMPKALRNKKTSH